VFLTEAPQRRAPRSFLESALPNADLRHEACNGREDVLVVDVATLASGECHGVVETLSSLPTSISASAA
jgi:hypothetical protein